MVHREPLVKMGKLTLRHTVQMQRNIFWMKNEVLKWFFFIILNLMFLENKKRNDSFIHCTRRNKRNYEDKNVGKDAKRNR